MLSFLLLFSGCYFNERFLQKADIRSACPQHPVTVIENYDQVGSVIQLQVTGQTGERLGLNTGNHSLVNADGQYVIIPFPGLDRFYPDDAQNLYEFKGENLIWHQPDLQLQVNYTSFMWKNISLMLGARGGLVENQLYWGGTTGLGFYGETREAGYFFETYVHLQKIRYHLEYIEGYDQYWFAEADAEKMTVSPGLALSINSKNTAWPVNGFFRAGWESMTFFNFAGQDGQEFSQIQSYLSLSAGVFKTYSGKQRWLAGIETQMLQETRPPLSQVQLFLQFDLIQPLPGR